MQSAPVIASAFTAAWALRVAGDIKDTSQYARAVRLLWSAGALCGVGAVVVMSLLTPVRRAARSFRALQERIGLHRLIGYPLVLLLIFLLLLLLLPTLTVVTEHARRTRCASNLKQIGYALRSYAADNSGQFPRDLSILYPAYISESRIYVCPGERSRWPYARPSRGRYIRKDGFYCYVSGLSAGDDADCILAFDEEWNHEGVGATVLDVRGDIRWRRVEYLHAALEEQLAEHGARGRKVRIIRPPWSRWPDPPAPFPVTGEAAAFVARAAWTIIAIDALLVLILAASSCIARARAGRLSSCGEQTGRAPPGRGNGRESEGGGRER